MSDGMSEAYREQRRNEEAVEELKLLAAYMRSPEPEQHESAVRALRNMYKVTAPRAETLLGELLARNLATWVRFLAILNDDCVRAPFIPLSPFAGKVVRVMAVTRWGEESGEYIAALKALPGVEMHEVDLSCHGRYRLIVLPKPQ